MKYAPAMLAFMAFAAPVFARDEIYLVPTHITTSSGKIITLQLEPASTPEARTRGLMDRSSLKPAEGMAFFFPAPATQKFWMKNTIIPLDILFVDAENRIVDVAHGLPGSLMPMGTDTPVISVIEIEAGAAALLGIGIGDTVHYDTETLSLPRLR